jgi:hypothetical protein
MIAVSPVSGSWKSMANPSHSRFHKSHDGDQAGFSRNRLAGHRGKTQGFGRGRESRVARGWSCGVWGVCAGSGAWGSWGGKRSKKMWSKVTREKSNQNQTTSLAQFGSWRSALIHHDSWVFARGGVPLYCVLPSFRMPQGQLVSNVIDPGSGNAPNRPMPRH